MGTNYYMAVNVCSHCGRGEEELHIGKSSAGWVFALNTHPEHGLVSLDAWSEAWETNPIRNEYGDPVTADEMLGVVIKRGPGKGGWDAEFLARNQATPGPNGLLRAAVDGRLCIGHGDGTYDLMAGEFS